MAEKLQSLNRIELIAKVGLVSKFSVGSSNDLIVNLSVANSYAYEENDGTPIIETTWFNVKAYAEQNSKNIEIPNKGNIIRVVGRLRPNSYTGENGVIHTHYDVFASSIEILSKENELLEPEKTNN